MPVFIAMLRGVNVGGRQKLTNAMLQQACERAGVTSVRTYLQSGNVVFRTNVRSADRVATTIRTALTDTAGLSVDVIIRTVAELRHAIGMNPIAPADLNTSGLLVVFLGQPISASALAALEKDLAAGELIEGRDRELYAYFPNGIARSKLANSFTERRLGVTCTARNWNTVSALRRLAEDVENS